MTACTLVEFYQPAPSTIGEDGGSELIRNVGNFLLNYTVSHSKK
jgi:hypothetical protein